MHKDTHSRIRIALVVRPAAGGILSHVRTLISCVDRSSFEPLIAAPKEFLAMLNTDVEQIPCEISGKTNPITDLKMIQRLSADLKGRCDLIHAHGIRGAFIGVLAADKMGVPSIFTAHNQLAMPHGFTRLALRFLAGKSTAIIAVSDAVKLSLVDAGFPITKIDVIPNGIDLEPFSFQYEDAETRKFFGLNPQGRIVLGLGRLSREKGFDLLIEAFGKLASHTSDVQLVIAGDGPEAAALKHQAENVIHENTNLTKSSIKFTGRTNKTAQLLQSASVVVIPSREEGQGLAALEAMAAGRIVIAAKVGGLLETIQDGVNGLLTPAEDAASLAEAMKRVLDDPDLAARLGKAGRHRVETEYTATLMMQRLEKLYRSCIDY